MNICMYVCMYVCMDMCKCKCVHVQYVNCKIRTCHAVAYIYANEQLI